MATKREHPSYNPDDEKEKSAILDERQRILFALYAAQVRLLEVGDSASADTLIKLSQAIFGLGNGQVAPFLKKNPISHNPGTNLYEANSSALACAFIDLWIAPKQPDRMTLKKATAKASKILKETCGLEIKPDALKKRREKIRKNKPESTHASQIYWWAKKVCWDGNNDAESLIMTYLKQR